MSRPKVGVLLAGCGVYDGSEIHEAVITLLALDRGGAEAVCFAPEAPQHHVVDHVAGKVAPGERRSVLLESARIARGKVRPLAEAHAAELDALVMPGGFGVAKNLCDFASAAEDCRVDPQVAALVAEVHRQGKWVGAMCIAPVVLARVLGDEKPRLTIGSDPGTAAAIEKMGAHHVKCPVQGVVIDEERRLVTTPAYMLAESISEAASGIEALVGALLARVRTAIMV